MTDPRTDTERGWQNVLRNIRRMLRIYQELADEPPLEEQERAEREAWQVAHDAVLERIAAMDGNHADAK